MSGFAAIPRNMTGMATKMAAAGYKTAAFGKWDAGMATPDHTPHGRGYMTALNYFHHCNDYWSMTDGSGCAVPAPTPPTPEPPAKCGPKFPNSNWCAGSSPSVGPPANTANAGDCCALCTGNEKCVGWTWGKFKRVGNWSCFLHSEVVEAQKGNCTSSCKVLHL
jgi:hypothetical protein